MTAFQAGFGRSDITPATGCRLMGYGLHNSSGLHDRLAVRALALEMNGERWVLLSCYLCYLNAATVGETHAAIQQRLKIAPTNLFLAAVHTHSGPHDRDGDNWARPLPELITDAVEAAIGSLRPAKLDSGYGVLYGASINRRWSDKPVDPAILVLRVDDSQGKLLGLLSIYGCHAVVLGSDNLQISGDWPGYAMRELEEKLGPDITALYFQGGAGDINPLVEGVRKRLHSGKSIRAIGDVSTYYGPPDQNAWNIGNRGGGTFEEVAELGAAYCDEVAYLTQTIATNSPQKGIWSEQVIINAAADPGEHPNRPQAAILSDMVAAFDEKNIPTELMLFGLGDLVLVGEPGEVFSETAVNVRMGLRNMGYKAPMLVSYANGWYFYLPEPAAFVEGGYEPNWAATINISRNYQARVWNAVKPTLEQRVTTK